MSLLANRYASEAMREIFAPEAKIIAERRLWIAVMRAQSSLGHAISDAVITDYEQVITQVDLAAIDIREKQTRHDVKARIEEFNALAGHEAIHAGMTSRDITENIEALQFRNGLEVVHDKVVTLLARLGESATQFSEQPIAGRSHNVPAQVTTLGKRFASTAEELLFAYQRLTALQDRYPMRGIKGPVGTAQDSIDLLGSTSAHFKLESEIARELGFDNVLDSTGQVYPRSFDYDVVTTLVQIAAAPSSLATSIRLMAGAELVTEGFKAGQVGSSAMPHKMNSRSCERINGLHAILKGHVTMASALAGDQWNEGDVSCSVVRRVVLPDAFFALDGLLETTLVVLQQMEIYPAVVRREVERYLPFLLTTTFLMEAVKNGVGRETAHELIKNHAVAAARGLRDGTLVENDLLKQLVGTPELKLSAARAAELLQAGAEQTGAATSQVRDITKRAEQWLAVEPEAEAYRPGEIL